MNRPISKKVFWRLCDNKRFGIYECDHLGFSAQDPRYIPDEYLNSKNFLLFRTCFAIGDCGIISAMPRKLKEKYPDCKIYLPSEKLQYNLFSDMINQNEITNRPFRMCREIFDNNPYIDGFVDSFSGEVYHDHYRIYDHTNIDPRTKATQPLIKQLLKFWQFKDNELDNVLPELYFSKAEIDLGDKIINAYTGNKPFGTLLLSLKYDFKSDEKLLKAIADHDLPYYYWSSKPIEKTNFNSINKVLDISMLPLRIQFYIKTKAAVNIGSQAGMNDTIARYAKQITVQINPLYSNVVETIEYI